MLSPGQIDHPAFGLIAGNLEGCPFLPAPGRPSVPILRAEPCHPTLVRSCPSARRTLSICCGDSVMPSRPRLIY